VRRVGYKDGQNAFFCALADPAQQFNL